MKTRLLVASILGGLAMVAGVMFGLSKLSPVHAAAVEVTGATVEYIIGLPMPELDMLLELDERSPFSESSLLSEIAHRQAGELIHQLVSLREQGRIEGFELRPDLFAILVHVASDADPGAALGELPGGLSLSPSTPDSISCRENAAAAVLEQARAATGPTHQIRAEAIAAGGPSGDTPNATIYIYAPPGGGWTDVTVNAPYSSTVAMTITRGPELVYTATETACASGLATFYPEYLSCSRSNYSWSLRPGDVVEVSIDGQVYRTTVAYVSAWIDAATDTAGGTTDKGRRVDVTLKDYQQVCRSNIYTATTVANASGGWNVSFKPVDFDRTAEATVEVFDAQGFCTYASFSAARITTEVGNRRFAGYLKPLVPYVAVVTRGAVATVGSDALSESVPTVQTVYTATGITSPDGGYSASFTTPIAAGDRLSVSGGGLAIQYEAVTFVATLDADQDRVTGTAGGARRVVGRVERTNSVGLDPDLVTACSDNNVCVYTTTQATGLFTIPLGMDLLRGDDSAWFNLDAEGNYQYLTSRAAAAIVAKVGMNEVVGFWRVSNPAPELTVILKDSYGAQKAIRTELSVDSWDSGFSATFGETIQPGDVIEVGDGVYTETMQVGNVTTRLSGVTGHLSGSAPNGKLLAVLRDERCGTTYYYCQETMVTSGTYALVWPGADVDGQDTAWVWSTGADGQYTRATANTFQIEATVGERWVRGYTETGGATVTATIKTGAVVKGVVSAVSDSGGWFSLSFGGAAIPEVGDTLIVQTSDGSELTLVIPSITMHKDTAHNRVYGVGPAGDGIAVKLGKALGRYATYYWSIYATADESGQYSAWFGDKSWYDCTPVLASDECTWPAVQWCAPGGHLLNLSATPPPVASADIYESDNTFGTAKSYSGIQIHTFHNESDVDWVQLTVPQSAVSNHVPYRIETLDLGFGMDTVLYLYASNGTTLLTQDDDSGKGWASLIVWYPTAAGTYYVRVKPAHSGVAGYCDAVYSLRIGPIRYRVLVPVAAVSAR